MWEPRRLTTLWDLTACYRDSFAFFTYSVNLDDTDNLCGVNVNSRRSQWPSGLRHEMSSPAWTLGSWVRIPLEAWMSVSVNSVVCVVLCR
jgi:hypothetical protein